MGGFLSTDKRLTSYEARLAKERWLEMEMDMNNETDPTGLAALIIGAVTPVITLVAVLVGMTTEVSNLLIAAVTGVVNGAVGVWAVMQARKHAYAPKTVDKALSDVYHRGKSVGVAWSTRPDEP